MTASLTATEPIAPEERPSYSVPQYPALFTWTVTMYHRAIELGLLDENDRVELIAGQIINKMPIGVRHADCVGELTEYFVNKLAGKGCKYHPQNPLRIADHSEPEPDFLVLDKAKYKSHEGKPIPDDVHLLFEVSDSTLAFDRGDKAILYAQAGIKEYWIINLQSDSLELHTQPHREAGVYNSIQRYPATASFESPFCGTVVVADLLPENE